MRDAAAPTAIVAEDEPQLAAELCRLLAALWPELRVVHRAADGVAAVRAVDRYQPDVAFLDIQMPQLSGLDAARQIGGRCHVVFITAFDQHAIDAFEAGAVDYLLKPLTTARFLTTLQRLRKRLDTAPRDLARVVDAIDRQGRSSGHLQWISASVGSQVRVLAVEDVLYFRSDSKYTLVVCADSESVIRKTIKELAEELDPGLFWQIHRSAIVNIRAIESVVHAGSRNLAVRLKGRSEVLPVAENYRHLFRQM